MKDEIERRFARNLDRVRSLIQAYEAALPGGRGRPSVALTDILRASVVFLHASLEDLLRSILAWKMPTADAAHFADVPLAGEKPRKYTLIDIARHRGISVDSLIVRSVEQWLDHSNFNDVTEVAKVLTRVGVPKEGAAEVLDRHGTHLKAMMKRRHWIVHRADRNQAKGSGQFAARSLHPDAVRSWLSSVEAFGGEVLDLL